jgi:hypothetical protein
LAQAAGIEFERVDHRAISATYGEPPLPISTRTVSTAPATFWR